MAPGLLGGTLTEWLTLLVLVLGPGLVATVLWSPVLASSRLRTLFRALPATTSTGVNYVLTALVLSAPWVVGLGWTFARVGARTGTDAVSGEPLMDVAGQLGLLYLVGLPVVAGAGLPWLGLDWDPTDYGVGTWLRLVVAGAWYAALFAVPAFAFGVIVSLPG
jgi:hypothetical protein